MVQAGELRDALAEGITRIYRTRKDVDVVLARVRQVLKDANGDGEPDQDAAGGGADAEDGPADPHKQLQRAGQRLNRTLTELEEALWVPPDTKGIPYEEDKPWNIAGRAVFSMTSSNDAPTAAQLVFLRLAEVAVGEALAEINRVFDENVAEFRRMVADSDIQLLPEAEPLRMP
jgi:hypothetical protein